MHLQENIVTCGLKLQKIRKVVELNTNFFLDFLHSGVPTQFSHRTVVHVVELIPYTIIIITATGITPEAMSLHRRAGFIQKAEMGALRAQPFVMWSQGEVPSPQLHFQSMLRCQKAGNSGASISGE